MHKKQQSSLHVSLAILVLTLTGCATVVTEPPVVKTTVELRTEKTNQYVKNYLFNYCMLTMKKIDHADKNIQQHCTDYSNYPPATFEIMKEFTIE